ncbi:MAG: ABC transporter permease [Gaiellaceae bacterium]
MTQTQMEPVEPPVEGIETPTQRSRKDRTIDVFTRAWLFVFLLLLIGYFTASTPSHTFFSSSNFQQIALSTSEVILLAIGETFIIVTAGIDLSIGGILFFAGALGGEVMLHTGGDVSQEVQNGVYSHATRGILLGVVVCILAGTLWGVLNGVLVTLMRLPPFIVTLGTLGMTFGFGELIIPGGSYLQAPVPAGLSNHIGGQQSAKFLGLYNAIWLALVLLLLAHVLFRYTRFGRYTCAVGSNEEGARRTGIAVDRHIIKVYGLAGLLAGVAAVIDLAIYTNTTAVSHQNDNLSAISAVVLGGTSLFGGVGSILLSGVGAFIPTILQNGLVIKSVQPYWQQVVVGAVIIFAVYLDQLRRRRWNR